MFVCLEKPLPPKDHHFLHSTLSSVLLRGQRAEVEVKSSLSLDLPPPSSGSEEDAWNFRNQDTYNEQVVSEDCLAPLLPKTTEEIYLQEIYFWFAEKFTFSVTRP